MLPIVTVELGTTGAIQWVAPKCAKLQYFPYAQLHARMVQSLHHCRGKCETRGIERHDITCRRVDPILTASLPARVGFFVALKN